MCVRACVCVCACVCARACVNSYCLLSDYVYGVILYLRFVVPYVNLLFLLLLLLLLLFLKLFVQHSVLNSWRFI